MASSYDNYLASNVLNDEKIVTFRVLSRALGINSHQAKRMLFDFHRRHNAKKAGSVYATYLVTGLKKQQSSSANADGDASNADGEDVEMRSSPSPGKSEHQSSESQGGSIIKTMTLVREDQLEALKSLYEEVSSIYMYSIQRGPLNNLDLITSVYEQLYTDSQKGDLQVTSKDYGTIQNPLVKRRPTNRPAPAKQATGTAVSQASAKAMFNKTSDSKKASDQKTDEDKTGVKSAAKSATVSSSAKQAPPPSSGESSSSQKAKPPALKRDKSDLLKAFAKTRAPKPKADPGPTDSSAHGAHSMPIADLSTRADVKQAHEDIDMGDDDEGDGESRLIEGKSVARSNQKTQAERDAELKRKIFDDDGDEEDKAGEDKAEAEDEEMADAPASEAGGGSGQEGSSGSRPGSRSSNASMSSSGDGNKTTKNKRDAGEAEDGKDEQQVTISDGRRRGRRRIMRKRMIKDAEGYLVTREEPGWESFSEEDVPDTKTQSSSQFKSSAAKGKIGGKASKGGGDSGSATPTSSAGGGNGGKKKGQGNIMSFFGKK